ncbi:hypothetical protein V8E52_003202 [Russula decolorans]|jgi:hypothetical protein
MLPDVVLIEIFEFYVNEAEWIDAWHTLVHVCRKWRIIAFGSPRRLNLQLYCSPTTPVKKTLAVWPPLPIVIRQYGHPMCGMHNVIAALKHNYHVCEIELWRIPSSLLEQVLASMQMPFPALTNLRLGTKDETAPVVPDWFLGGSAPRLRHLTLRSIHILELPKLLLSATDLVDLSLRDIPHSGYIPPETIVACLSTLTRLKTLIVEFKSPQSRPDPEHRRPPPVTLTILPALRDFKFKGVSEYLEDLVARIDAPLLHSLAITLFHQLIFETPHLSQFFSRTLKSKALNDARIVFEERAVQVSLPLTSGMSPDETLSLGISCRESEWQLSSLAQVFTLTSPLFSSVERLYISEDRYWPPHWQDDTEGAQWLELLQPFAAVKNLFLSKEVALRIAPALRRLVWNGVTEMLPTLQCLFLEGLQPSDPVQETIRPFVAARRFIGHFIPVSHWDGEKNKW